MNSDTPGPSLVEETKTVGRKWLKALRAKATIVAVTAAMKTKQKLDALKKEFSAR